MGNLIHVLERKRLHLRHTVGGVSDGLDKNTIVESLLAIKNNENDQVCVS